MTGLEIKFNNHPVFPIHTEVEWDYLLIKRSPVHGEMEIEFGIMKEGCEGELAFMEHQLPSKLTVGKVVTVTVIQEEY